jgi:lysophospholipase L1-like esterase
MINLWGYDISWFVWFCAAGKAFFPGIGLLVLSAVIPLFRRGNWLNLIRYIFIVLGIVLVFLSATPVSDLIYTVWAVSFLIFLIFIVRSPHAANKAYWPRVVFVFICIAALVIELPFHFVHGMPRGNFKKLYVIGDSVSAGIGGKSERTWPVIFSEKYGVEVNNLSVAGATVGSILKQTEKISNDNAIVLLEIGGNDLLSMTPQPVFEQNLRSLLQKVVKPNRAVLMFELPLAPWHIGYGRIQRKLAAESGVVLIPKSFLADIFGTKGATADLAHLSPEGHKIMAERVGIFLGKYLNRDSKSQ